MIQELKVDKVVIAKQGENSKNYQEFKRIANDKKINVIVTKKGDVLNIEKNLKLKVLWPSNDFIENNILNNNSIVAKLEYNKFSMLFTGDIEKIAEQKIIDEYKNKTNLLKSDVLKVGHHGSKTSSIDEFIKIVKPKIALIGVGENNIFGHPSDIVLERLKSNNVTIYRTDKNGEISLYINRNGLIKKISKNK